MTDEQASEIIEQGRNGYLNNNDCPYSEFVEPEKWSYWWAGFNRTHHNLQTWHTDPSSY